MNILQKLIQVQLDASEFGLEYPDPLMILNQVIDECREVKEDIEQASSREKLQEEIGDLLHAAISLCVFLKFNVEETLEKTNIKFEKRMTDVKKLVKSKGLDDLNGKSIEYILDLWNEVKNKKACNV